MLRQTIPAMYSSTEENKDRKLVKGTENGGASVLHQPPKHMPAEQPLIWQNIIVIAVLHVAAIYLLATRYREAKFWTWMWGMYLLKQLLSQFDKFSHCHRRRYTKEEIQSVGFLSFSSNLTSPFIWFGHNSWSSSSLGT